MPIAQMLLPELDHEMANTRKFLELVPEDKFDYKPHEKSMTLGRLAGHVAEMAGWGKTTLELEVLNLDASMQPCIPTTRAQVLEIFDKGVAEFRARLEKATDADLAKTWTMNYCGKQVFSMPRAAVLRSMVLNHIVHHRAQLGVYLRLNEIEIPGVYGPSADEMKYWKPAQAAS